MIREDAPNESESLSLFFADIDPFLFHELIRALLHCSERFIAEKLSALSPSFLLRIVESSVGRLPFALSPDGLVSARLAWLQLRRNATFARALGSLIFTLETDEGAVLDVQQSAMLELGIGGLLSLPTAEVPRLVGQLRGPAALTLRPCSDLLPMLAPLRLGSLVLEPCGPEKTHALLSDPSLSLLTSLRSLELSGLAKHGKVAESVSALDASLAPLEQLTRLAVRFDRGPRTPRVACPPGLAQLPALQSLSLEGFALDPGRPAFPASLTELELVAHDPPDQETALSALLPLEALEDLLLDPAPFSAPLISQVFGRVRCDGGWLRAASSVRGGNPAVKEGDGEGPLILSHRRNERALTTLSPFRVQAPAAPTARPGQEPLPRVCAAARSLPPGPDGPVGARALCGSLPEPSQAAAAQGRLSAGAQMVHPPFSFSLLRGRLMWQAPNATPPTSAKKNQPKLDWLQVELPPLLRVLRITPSTACSSWDHRGPCNARGCLQLLRCSTTLRSLDLYHYCAGERRERRLASLAAGSSSSRGSSWRFHELGSAFLSTHALGCRCDLYADILKVFPRIRRIAVGHFQAPLPPRSALGTATIRLEAVAGSRHLQEISGEAKAARQRRPPLPWQLARRTLLCSSLGLVGSKLEEVAGAFLWRLRKCAPRVRLTPYSTAFARRCAGGQQQPA